MRSMALWRSLANQKISEYLCGPVAWREEGSKAFGWPRSGSEGRNVYGLTMVDPSRDLFEKQGSRGGQGQATPVDAEEPFGCPSHRVACLEV